MANELAATGRLELDWEHRKQVDNLYGFSRLWQRGRLPIGRRLPASLQRT
jgi:hypothetical protein